MNDSTIFSIDDQGALRLAEAIVGGICDDYRDQLRALQLCANETQRRRIEAQIQGTEALIRSDYFGKLSMNAIGGEEIIRSIRSREEEGC